MAHDPLGNPRQEAYCRGRALGLRQCDAYEQAGYKFTTDNARRSAASRLETDVNIQRRIRQIQTDMVDTAAIGPDWVISRLVHESENAQSDGARARCLELLGKVNRLFVDVIETPTEQNMSDEDLARSIAGDDTAAYNRLLVLIRNVGQSDAA